MSIVRVQLNLEDAEYALSIVTDELRLADEDGIAADHDARLSLERIIRALSRAAERGGSERSRPERELAVDLVDSFASPAGRSNASAD